MDKHQQTTVCPGCGLVLPASGFPHPDRFNASGECWQLFSDLSGYTVARQDPAFVHQHVVDAYEAQHAGSRTKNITVAFGLIGLYLALEKGYTGKEIQRAHMQLANVRKDWPRLDPPLRPVSITVRNVLMAAEGPARDAMIRAWMAAVWEGWADRQQWVRETTDALLARGRERPRH